MNFILIGMPSAGKSTLGVVTAKMLGYDYLDTDLLIQKREGRRLEEIISEIGQEAFLNLEADVCSAVEAENTVIATGGSIIYRAHTMEHLKAIGTVVYLKISLETLLKRLHDAQSRGVVLKEGQTLEGLYNERIDLYEKYADIAVDEGEMDFESTLESLHAVLAARIQDSGID
jgi:shikimate kinase